jgi:hypothetical protein
MTKNDVLAWMGVESAAFPERTSGNEINEVIAQRIAPLLDEDRRAVVDALRELLALRIPESDRESQDGIREARLFLALEITVVNGLVELREDIRALIADVRSRKTFKPYYAEMLARYLKKLE